jgi:hypothetical protein
MSDPQDAIAGTFVEPRGMIRTIVAATAGRELAGAVGELAASRAASEKTAGASPLGKGQIAYLSVFEQEIVLFKAKRGAFRPKPTDQVIASAPRAQVGSAEVDKGRLGGVLEVIFVDGTSWSFDVPKVHLSGAKEIAATLA